MSEERTLSPNHEQKEASPEKRREEKEYSHSHIAIAISPTKMKNRRFYVPTRLEITFKKLETAALIATQLTALRWAEETLAKVKTMKPIITSKP